MKLYDPTHANQLRDVRHVDCRNGITRLALAFDTTRAAVRWFTTDELRKANTALAIAEILSEYECQQVARAVIFEATAQRSKRMSVRKLYQIDLYARIADAIADKPAPDVYPREVFLAAANYYLHIEAMQIDPMAAAKSARMIAKAVAEGQIVKAA